jgi:hypothetical protein
MHHRLRGAHLVVRAATVAIDLVLLVATSFLRVLGRPWAGCGLILAPPLPESRQTFFHERASCLATYTLLLSFFTLLV